MDDFNPANTNVMPVPNSNILYALCEAGSPYRLTKDALDCQGFDDLGFLKHSYSAHPKIDPENGDVYNFGHRMNTLGI
jgi:all-trans-8'-apo-beta-carotenal 15,15'-oxygenase